MTTSATSNSILGNKNGNLSTSCTDEPLTDPNISLNKSTKDTLNDSNKDSFGAKEDQQRVKFSTLPAIDKKEKKVKRRRTPYAWDDQLRPVFDDDKKKVDKKGK